MFTQFPVSSDGFILNLIDVLLIFSKPFSGKFSEYHNHIGKINCFYLYNDAYILNGTKIEKIDSEALQYLQQGDIETLPFTHITVEPSPKSSFSEVDVNSSSNFEIPPANFITECFFMIHILINMIHKKIE